MRTSLVTIATLALLTVTAAACQSDSSPPDDWNDVEMANQPALFEMREGHPALVDLEQLYLGQPKEAAVDALGRYCEHPVRREAGMFGGDAYFLGCRIEEDETLNYVRVGFWPKIGERVATLEVKRSSVPPAAVRRGYLDLLEEAPEETLRLQRVQITSASYRMFADWEESGRDGPVHLVVGFAPDISSDGAAP